MTMNPYSVGSFPGHQQISRSSFIRSTYLYLCGAILGFIILTAALFQTSIPEYMLVFLSSFKYGWLALLGGFMLIGYLASSVANTAGSRLVQIFGLGLYVVLQTLICLPLLALAFAMDPKIIPAAGICTLLLVGGLTFTAFTTKADFSFLGGLVNLGVWIALGIIVASIIFGFTLGIFFSGAMVLLMGGAILYETSSVIHHYPYDRPAGAALVLFSSIVTMFFYIVRIFMLSRD